MKGLALLNTLVILTILTKLNYARKISILEEKGQPNEYRAGGRDTRSILAGPGTGSGSGGYKRHARSIRSGSPLIFNGGINEDDDLSREISSSRSSRSGYRRRYGGRSRSRSRSRSRGRYRGESDESIEEEEERRRPYRRRGLRLFGRRKGLGRRYSREELERRREVRSKATAALSGISATMSTISALTNLGQTFRGMRERRFGGFGGRFHSHRCTVCANGRKRRSVFPNQAKVSGGHLNSAPAISLKK